MILLHEKVINVSYATAFALQYIWAPFWFGVEIAILARSSTYHEWVNLCYVLSLKANV